MLTHVVYELSYTMACILMSCLRALFQAVGRVWPTESSPMMKGDQRLGKLVRVH